MQLYYIWTKKFKNIHEKGFSLSDRYLIYYDTIGKSLYLKENPQYISSFFSGKVTEVTAVIGANGAGKSNLFELLKYTLSSFTEGAWTAYGLESIVVADNLIFYHESLTISNIEDLKARNFICYSYKETIARHDTDEGKEANILTQDERLRENGYVYYSNAFDRRLEDATFSLADVSTNHLVWADKAHSPGTGGMEYLSAFYNSETRRQMDFLGNSKADLPFSLPQSVFITIDEEIDSRVSTYSSAFDGTELEGFKDFHHYRIATKLSDEEEENQEVLRPYFRRLFLYKLFIVLQLNDPDKFRQTNGGQFELMVRSENNDDLDAFYQGEQLADLKDMLATLDDIIAEGQVIPQPIEHDTKISERYSTLKLQFPDNDRTKFMTFVKQFGKVSQNYNFLSFFWNGLSSGELAMLNLYARLYAGLKHLRVAEKEHLVIMIDEGETNLHPEWQTELLYNLIGFFNDIFKGKTVQLILTSHSPFLISDLPKSKINFLDKDKDGNCTVVDSALELKQTFGANIHTLYADAFFMKNALMGRFAKEKLNKLIAIINQESGFDDEFPNWEVVEKCIAFIGEPILRGMLERQFMTTRQATIEDIDGLRQQMADLNERIKKLEEDNGTDQID